MSADANVSEPMRAADKRLYEAKNRGWNLAIFDSGIPAAPDRLGWYRTQRRLPSA